MGNIVPLKLNTDSQSRSDWLLWKYAIDKEFRSFDKLHVHSTKMTTCYAMDMDTVFLHSDLQPHEQIPSRPNDTMKTTETGTTLRHSTFYDVQPDTHSAESYWTCTQDTWLMTECKNPPWHIKRMILEQCIFIMVNIGQSYI